MDRRARITLPDLVNVLAALAILAALAPVFLQVFDAVAGSDLSTGETLVFSILTPGAVLVLLAVIYQKAAGGAV